MASRRPVKSLGRKALLGSSPSPGAIKIMRRTVQIRLRVSLAGKTLGSEPREATFEP